MDAISNRSLKARVGALAVSLVMATAIATPALAFADGTTSQSTDVTIQSVTPDPDGDNLSFSVPTQIPFVAKADGTMLAPSADTLKIQNKPVRTSISAPGDAAFGVLPLLRPLDGA